MKKYKMITLLFLMTLGLLGLFQNMTTRPSPPLVITMTPEDVDPLKNAHAKVSAALKLEDRPIIIEFQAGTYYAQSIKWTAIPKKYSIIFRPVKGAENLVVFDGRLNAEEAAKEIKGKLVTLFSFSPKAIEYGKYSNITVKNITIQYYLEGINFLADRNDRNLFIGNNKVLNTSFINIGNLYAEVFENTGELRYGLAVIRLVNSRDGTFKGNHFENIKNDKGAGQHAFYVAHHSENNLIEGNVFLNHTTGSVIKLRDQSHYNKIISNVFNRFNPVAIQVWHCDANQVVNASGGTRGFRFGSEIDSSVACTKFKHDSNLNVFSNTECFSYGAEERGNYFLQDGKKVVTGQRNL